ncbi:MAG: hypothetical protein HW398_1341, partial [Acidobacteria bacterium]|nr:hypothetical protein [Acidobacteriota bacterium]
MRGFLTQQFAEAVALAFVLGVARGHAVRFVHDHQVPVIGLAHTRQNLVALGQVHRGDELRFVVPEIHAVLHPQIAAAQDVEALLEFVGHFALPLEGEVGRTHNQDAFGEPAQFQFLDQQARHDGLAGARIVGEQEAAPRRFQQVIVNRVELVRQGIDPRNGKAEVGVVFLRQRNAERFDAEFDEPRVC